MNYKINETLEQLVAYFKVDSDAARAELKKVYDSVVYCVQDRVENGYSINDVYGAVGYYDGHFYGDVFGADNYCLDCPTYGDVCEANDVSSPDELEGFDERRLYLERDVDLYYRVKKSFASVVREFEEEVGELTSEQRDELQRVYEATKKTFESTAEEAHVYNVCGWSRATICYLDGHFSVELYVYGAGRAGYVDVPGVESIEDTDDAEWQCVLTLHIVEE